MGENQSSIKLLTIQRQLTIVVLALAIFIIGFQICFYFADILRILGISILFSYLFIAVVDWLYGIVKSRVLAVTIVYAVVLLSTIFSAITIIPTLISQISQLLNTVYLQLPQLVQSLTQFMSPFEHKLHSAQIEIRTIDLLNTLLSCFSKIGAGQIFDRVGDVAISTMTWAAYGLCVLVLSFYFLLDGYKMQNAIISLFPNRFQTRLRLMATEIDQSLQAFFRGQVVLALGFGLLMTFIYYILGVHYALLLGIFLAIWEVVPVIGPPIGFIPTILSVAFDGTDNLPVNRFTQVILVFACFNGLQWLKDNLVAPKYMGNVMGLHPVLIFLAIIIGAKIDGWLGIIFALPLACVINVIGSHLYAIFIKIENAKQKHHPE